jgi:hypothetical protein
MEKKSIQTALGLAALDKGKVVVHREDGSRIIVGKGAASLMRWLDSGPHGEAAQDSMDDGRFEEDDYEGY